MIFLITQKNNSKVFFFNIRKKMGQGQMAQWMTGKGKNAHDIFLIKHLVNG